MFEGFGCVFLFLSPPPRNIVNNLFFVADLESISNVVLSKLKLNVSIEGMSPAEPTWQVPRAGKRSS